MLRLRSKEVKPELYSIAAAAQACGISKTTLRYLETQLKVVTPMLVKDTTRCTRAYTADDLQMILQHYQRRGGMKNPNPRRKC